jgi:hypothetical protein
MNGTSGLTANNGDNLKRSHKLKAFNIVETGKGLESWRRVELPDPTPGLQ